MSVELLKNVVYIKYYDILSKLTPKSSVRGFFLHMFEKTVPFSRVSMGWKPALTVDS